MQPEARVWPSGLNALSVALVAVILLTLPMIPAGG
jgi:hypothetical protein